MKRNLITTLTLLLVAAITVPLKADDAPKKPLPMAKYKLPMNPKTPVVVLDFAGGFTPPRVSDEPTMSILADGTVTIPKRFEGQKSFKGKLSLVELQQLLDFIIAEQKFFEYDKAAVEKKIKEAQGDGLRIAIADAPTTVIKVHANDKQHEFSRYALGMMANKVEELQRMQAIQRRLQQVMSRVSFGGKEEVATWLATLNKELAKKYPKVKPLTAAHLQSASERADGSKYISFSRNIPSADKKPANATITSVSASIPADGDPKINVNHREPKN